MHFTILDNSIILVLFALLVIVACRMQKYTRSVADFLAANRCAKRYLLTVAGSTVGMGFISVVGSWELYYKVGFSGIWWILMLLPAVSMLLSISGFVTYRLRSTMAMTTAEFFELRYSRKFRIFAGIVAWASGVLNYGLFPAIAGRCLIYLLGLPQYTTSIAGIEINLTLALVIGCLLTVAVIFAIMGGQITIIVTEFCQGQFVSIATFMVIIILLIKVDWHSIINVLSSAPQGRSMLDPFDIKEVQGFNLWYFIFQIVLTIYGYNAWQGSQSYNYSAISPHEARMAGILTGWRNYITNVFLFFVPVCIFTVLHGSGYTLSAEQINSDLASIADPQVRGQLSVPVGLMRLLPIGAVGLLCASFIAGNISTDTTYLHSWGSIMVQDVIMPLRGKPFTPKAHIKALRLSILGIGLFAFFFSLFFNLKDFIFMYFAITGAIYLGGAGAVILGGLYWRRGTTAGAWAAMIIGSGCSVIGIVLQNIFWPYFLPNLKLKYPSLLSKVPDVFPLTGMEMAFIFAMVALSAYIIISLLTKQEESLEFDKLFHRNKKVGEEKKDPGGKWNLFSRFGIGKEFTTSDKIIATASISLTLFWVIVFIIGNVIHNRFGISKPIWGKWWTFYFIINVTVSAIVAVWLFVGGLINFRDLVHLLKEKRRDNLDDGYVVGRSRLNEIENEQIHLPQKNNSIVD
jgi:SSS family solute:Na+ symporter